MQKEVVKKPTSPIFVTTRFMTWIQSS